MLNYLLSIMYRGVEIARLNFDTESKEYITQYIAPGICLHEHREEIKTSLLCKDWDLPPTLKRRVPPPNRTNISEILEKYDLKEYDPIALLLKTGGHNLNDEFYVESRNDTRKYK